MTITLNTQNESEQTVEGLAAEVGSARGPSAGQGLKTAIDISDEEADEIEAPRPQEATPRQPGQSSWARYVTGVDQALEDLRNEADERLLNEKATPQAAEPADTTSLDVDDGADRPMQPPSRAQALAFSAMSRRSRPGPDRSQAIDAAIGYRIPEESPSSRSALSGIDRADRANTFMRPDYEHSPSQGARASTMATLMALSATAARVLEGRSKRIIGPRRLLGIGGNPTKHDV